MSIDSGLSCNSTKTKPRVLLIAPVGEGVGGMICQANALVNGLNQLKLIDLTVIDSAQRYRDHHDDAFLRRAWGGGRQAVRRVAELLVSLIKFKPQSVQIWSSASLGLARDVVLVAITRVMGAKSFVTFHFGRIPELAIQRNWEWHLLSWVVRLSSGVQVLDCQSRSVLVYNFPNCEIRQFPNAIDVDWIDEICSRISDDKSRSLVPHIVFVGMVIPSKGVVELVEACTKIVGIDFELEMVGPVGPEMREELGNLAAGRNDGRWLKFSGALSRDKAVERIAASDIFVLPSHTEGFPVSVLEAMACSSAIVATSVGAIPEMLMGNNGEESGVLVPPGDSASLKLALEDLLQNSSKRLVLGSAARRNVEANYQLLDLARRWVSLWTGYSHLN